VPPNRLPPEWAGALASHGFDEATLDNLAAHAYADRPRTQPIEAATFRAYELSPLLKVRVVVVG
jgi:uracil-DNA glycosylase